MSKKSFTFSILTVAIVSMIGSGFIFAATEAPAAPQVNNYVQAGTYSLFVSWKAVPDAKKYQIYINTKNNPNTAVKAGEVFHQDYYLINALDSSNDYYVWVKSVNNAGTSNFSKVIKGSTHGES